MAIVANRSTEIGDVITIEVEVPIVGLIALTNFIDTTIGENATRFFNREFRHQSDGINWSAWQPLTLANVQAIQVSPSSVFRVEYRYTRSGTDPAGELEWDDALLQGQITNMSCGPVYEASVFAPFFSCMDIEVINWCINVLEKLYVSGIVPQYVTRGANSNQNFEDKDYLDFWGSISCYFALFVKYARTFEGYPSNPVLLLEFLKQRGMFICESTEHIDLLYLMEHYWNEIRRRGTPMMLLKKGELMVNGTAAQVDGEIIRLFCSCCCDELISSLTESWNTGFNIGNSSPLYTGLHNHANTNKGYDNTPGPFSQMPTPISLNAYPTFIGAGGSVATSTTPYNDGSQIEVIDIASPSEYTGFGLIDGSLATVTPEVKDKAMTYDPCTSYEISFLIRSSSPPEAYLNFSFQTYAKDWLPSFTTGGAFRMMRPDGTLNPPTYLNYFLSDINGIGGGGPTMDTWFPKADYWYQVKGIVYGIFDPNVTGIQAPKMAGLTSVDPINTATNFNLRPSADQFGNAESCRSACWAVPTFYTCTGTGTVSIANFEMRPRATDYSMGFLNLNGWINMWAHNSNAEYTYEEIEDILRYYLLPYNSNFRINKTKECIECGSAEALASMMLQLKQIFEPKRSSPVKHGG